MYKKPLSGAVIGIVIGVAIAVILARQGIWPADQLTVFLLPAATGLAGMLLLSMGRESTSSVTMIVALIILLPMAIWGALGIGDVNQNGELNGGCTVSATSAVDATTVTDTSRADPFEIDPDGSLSWSATSPEAFMDYAWEIHVVVGGIPVPIESDTEANDAGDRENAGDVANVGEYADGRGINLDLYVGVYQVGGSAGTCDGFGFVKITGDGLDIVTIIALVLLVLLIILLVVLFYSGRGATMSESDEVIDDSENIDLTDKLKGYEAGSDGPLSSDDLT